MPVTFNGKRLSDELRVAVLAGVVKATEAVRSEAIDLILNSPKSGKTYGQHLASAPGEPPASDTGYLVSQITTSYNERELTGTVKSGATYGPMLEFGTQTIEPRPYMRPALDNKSKEIQQFIAAAVVEAMQRFEQG